ncbi:hypothetical protein DPMN_083527 [Dreissena polymorpha]|uniref:Uncharacterized protein n=1 Tax=Dreissena polymorpha TaxID=45954 RepID=A0A9D3YD12_DREPO|nr:hypothetical protein DPMN_083527 [Dreissena polymorpha]
MEAAVDEAKGLQCMLRLQSLCLVDHYWVISSDLYRMTSKQRLVNGLRERNFYHNCMNRKLDFDNVATISDSVAESCVLVEA